MALEWDSKRGRRKSARVPKVRQTSLQAPQREPHRNPGPDSNPSPDPARHHPALTLTLPSAQDGQGV